MISAESLQWGLMMMVVGMGVVFALLLALMLVLMGIGALDRPAGKPRASRPAAEPPAAAPVAAAGDAEPEPAPAVRIIADGLDEDQVAAITVAVVTHAEVRRRIGGRETRAAAPGSQLFASRWLAVGRGNQTNPFSRR